MGIKPARRGTQLEARRALCDPADIPKSTNK